jgi:TPR repeat protein
VEKNKSPKVALQIAQLYEMLENETRNAMKWYQTAEEMGNLKAKYPLAILYCKEGNYAKFKDEEKSILEYASHARKEVKFNIGACYNDLGNISSAEYWFKEATKMGDQNAKKNLYQLLKTEYGYADNKAFTIIKNLESKN